MCIPQGDVLMAMFIETVLQSRTAWVQVLPQRCLQGDVDACALRGFSLIVTCATDVVTDRDLVLGC